MVLAPSCLCEQSHVFDPSRGRAVSHQRTLAAGAGERGAALLSGMLELREAESVVAVAVFAAMSDGRTDPTEREQLRSLLDTLAADADLPSLAKFHQAVVLKRIDLPRAIAGLKGDESKRMAFEIAVCVADADGKTTSAEQAFLDQLERSLGLNHSEALAFEREADAIAEADPLAGEDDPMVMLEPLPNTPAAPALGGGAAAATATNSITSQAPTETGPDTVGQEVDRAVLRYAILNGALELLPQNLATMAILPLQTRMVYTVGRSYGHTLGVGHIKEFVATLGIGATSQMLENFARKALGKFVGKTLGKTAGKVAKTATGPMMTFATTYGIGRVAKAYYAGGRKLSAVDLRSMFQQDLAKGKAAYEQHKGQIQQSAQTLDVNKVLRMVRGGTPV